VDERAASQQAVEHGGSERALQLLGDVLEEGPAAVIGLHLEVQESVGRVVEHAQGNLTDRGAGGIVE